MSTSLQKPVTENLLTNKKQRIFTLKRSSRWIIFLVFFLFNIIMNVDNGTINCASEEIEKFFFHSDTPSTDTNHNKEMGLFKCIVFLGTTFGSIISAVIINKISRKYFLIISAFCNGLCLFLFYWDFTNYYLYLIFRFCNGIFQSFVSIYLPAWCNQFGIKERRTIMLGLVQIGVPLGVVIGYGVTVWALSFFGTNKDNLKTGVSIYTYIYILYIVEKYLLHSNACVVDCYDFYIVYTG